MSTADKLIIAGVVTIPATFAVISLFAVTDGGYAFACVWVAVAVGAGLITSGILMRKNR